MRQGGAKDQNPKDEKYKFKSAREKQIDRKNKSSKN